MLWTLQKKVASGAGQGQLEPSTLAPSSFLSAVTEQWGSYVQI